MYIWRFFSKKITFLGLICPVCVWCTAAVAFFFGKKSVPGFCMPCVCVMHCRRRFFFGGKSVPGIFMPCVCVMHCRRRFFIGKKGVPGIPKLFLRSRPSDPCKSRVDLNRRRDCTTARQTVEVVTSRCLAMVAFSIIRVANWIASGLVAQKNVFIVFLWFFSWACLERQKRKNHKKALHEKTILI